MLLDKRQVQRQFDRSATSYDSVAGMQRDIVDQLLSAGKFANVESLLDAGCGTGYALTQLSKLAPLMGLHGVDLAQNMLEQALNACPKAQLLIADVEALPYSAGSHGVILSSSAIQWCEASNAIDEFNRCLSSEGSLLLSTFADGTLSQWRSLWGRDNQQRFLSLAEIEALFDEREWTDARIWQQVFVQSFGSFSEAVTSIRDLGAGDASPQRGAQPMTRKELAFVRNRVEQIIDQRGSVDLVYNVAFVHAKKVV